ncbi:uncharacterized protein PgNI_08730 [Pyricularia grisea]|uniref:Uncharacterized protein n=1 Tax=Pyricularia grisea TaxID=148305 RepID=A0A6P8AUC8_PYRGI|nr:uncharacterized protein PgNI_08730 [Pyricularia grisea]TLD05805.1 hypothetical protein PgNI_08730 [Pyricularia grisea]
MGGWPGESEQRINKRRKGVCDDNIHVCGMETRIQALLPRGCLFRVRFLLSLSLALTVVVDSLWLSGSWYIMHEWSVI